MDEKILCFAGAAVRRALAGCYGLETTSLFPSQIGSRAALLHHEGSDYDLAVQLSDEEYQLQGLDLLGRFSRELRNGTGAKVSCLDVQWENSTVKCRCMGCDVSLLVCGQSQRTVGQWAIHRQRPIGPYRTYGDDERACDNRPKRGC